MKLKLLTALALILISATLFSSCKKEEEGDDLSGGIPEESGDESYVYTPTSELALVVGEGVDGELVLSLSETLFESRGAFSPWKSADSSVEQHEIIIGNAERELVSVATDRLKRAAESRTSDDEFYYCIYSDGNSVAIVYEDDYDKVAEKLAVEHFIANYATSSTLTAQSGVVELVSFDIVEDYYGPTDEARRNTLWAKAAEKVGEETVEALKSMAALYDFRLIEWIASLYDPCICVCKGLGEEECQNTRYCKAQGAGFYFSNSARDNVGYLPDLESTRQALEMLDMSGMTWMYGGSYVGGALPEEMLGAIGRYTQVLQCSDGYFRHPQWADVADFDMRLNRDLSWATTLLDAAKMNPFYTTPTGIPGTGVPAEYAGEMTTKLDISSAAAVSKVISTASYPAILESVETLEADLAKRTKSLKTNSYSTGSRYATYIAQIKARDQRIGTRDNPTPLMSTLINWLEENKNPERGTWVGDAAWGGNPKQIGAYAETNGVMKIIGIYSNARARYSYGLEAMRACVSVLTTDEIPTGTVDIYNAWIALRGVYNCVINYGTAEEAEEAKAFMKEFRLNATEEVVASRDKLAVFKRADGSFSYWPNGGGGVSMGMPTQIKGSMEGDVNGALIASADCWQNIFWTLGISKVPIFGSAELYKFRKLIDEATPVEKKRAVVDSSADGFDTEEAEDAPNVAQTFSVNAVLIGENEIKSLERQDKRRITI